MGRIQLKEHEVWKFIQIGFQKQDCVIERNGGLYLGGK